MLLKVRGKNLGHLTEDIKVVALRPQDWLLEAARVSGFNAYKLVWELYFYFLVSGLTPDEYLRFRIYRRELSFQRKRSFKGGRKFGKWIRKTLKRRKIENVDLIDDKLRFADFSSGYGLRFPTHLAIYSETPLEYDYPNLEPTQKLISVAGISDFLRRAEHYPIFGKPIHNERALGSFGAKQYLARSDSVIFSDGREVPLEELAVEIADKFPEGYIFQKHLVQAPELEKLFGSLPSIFRATTIKFPGEKAKIWYIGGKISPAGSMASTSTNARRFTVPVDTKSGRIFDLFSFHKNKNTTYETFPDTDQNPRNVKLPNWEAIAPQLPALHDALGAYPVLGWDICFTPEGPLILEANYTPALETSQQVNDVGIGDPAFASVFK